MSKQEDIDKLLLTIKNDAGDAVNYNQLGNLYYDDNKIEDAKKCYLQAIDHDPNIAVFYENLALTNDDLSNWKEAAEAYEKALALKPVWNLYNSVGIDYYRMN